MDFDLRWADNDEERAAVYEMRYELYVEQGATSLLSRCPGARARRR